MRTRVYPVLTTCLLVLSAFCLSPSLAEEPAPEPVEAAPVPAAPETVTPAPPARPEIAPQLQVVEPVPDTEIFKRTPVVDGVVEEGEWDTFYTFTSGEWEVTTYADWDPRNLYVGAKSNKPFDLVAAIDATTDGWFHGLDNYEIRAVRAAEDTPTLAVSRYESRNTTTPQAVPVTPVEAGYVEMKSGSSDGAWAIEMCIPAKLIRGFKLMQDKRIGFQAAVKTASGESDWVPAAGPGDTRECTLVTKKFAKLNPLETGLDLRDYRIARGDELLAKFHLTNTGTEDLDVTTCLMGGEGTAAAYLSSAKIRMDGLPAKRHVGHELRSAIPSDMPLGCWAIGAEAKSNAMRLCGALASFEVVEPWEIELSLPETPVQVDVKDVALRVSVRNNTRRNLNGVAKITLPTGWEIWRSRDSYTFSVRTFTTSALGFRAKPPLGALGSVPVKMDVTIEGSTKSAEGSFELINP